MTVEGFKRELENITPKEDVVSKINRQYACDIPPIVAKIVSFKSEGLFFESDSFARLLSISEILHASTELHINFLEYGCIPLFDTGDNDFIVYLSKSSVWAKMNIVDKTIFKQRNNLFDLLKD